MRLTFRLLAAMLAAVIAVTAVATVARIQQLREALLADTRDDYVLFARGLRAVVADAWEDSGEDEARRILDRADAVDPDHELRIVLVDLRREPPPTSTLAIGRPRGREAAWVEDDHFIVVEPLGVERAPDLALRVERPMQSLSMIVDHNVWLSIISTGFVIVACLMLMSVLGWYFIGQPMQRLVAETRAIGRGELGHPAVFERDDELGELARELSTMSLQIDDAQKERLAAVEQLRHADRLRTVGQLASGLAHEIGTPLNVVSGRARLIQDADGATQEIRDDAEIIVEQTGRITSLVKQLLGFARQNAPRAQEIDIAGVAARVAHLLGPLATKRGLDIELSAPGGPCMAKCDALLIEQALTNVALNGLQAMHAPGRLTIGVTRRMVKLPRRKQLVPCGVLTVVDDGPGIASEAEGRLFDPFFTTKDVGEGTGLGLSVVYGILEDHGGSIEVGREPGRGARFDLYVPLSGSMIPPPGDMDRTLDQALRRPSGRRPNEEKTT